jgi:transcriptional repressor NrdR
VAANLIQVNFMQCPFCKSNQVKVLETRVQKEHEIRRRRECLECKGRFTTIETLLLRYPDILKRDGTREMFDVEKLRRGLQLACLKRQVSLPQIEQIVGHISSALISRSEKEVRSFEIGQLVMKELKKVDDVAYVRFASVYRTFKDVQEFVETLEKELEN